MANNYTQFSAAFHAEPRVLDDLEIRLTRAAQEPEDPNDIELYGIQWERQKDAEGHFLWLFSEEGGNLDLLIDIIAQLQLDFKLEKPWGFTWASWCSKLRIDEFAGGAVCIHMGEVEFINSTVWLQEKLSGTEGVKV